MFRETLWPTPKGLRFSWQVNWGSSSDSILDGAAMKRKAKSTAAKRGRGTWLIVAAAIILVLILLLRMLIFVAPHGRHHF